MNGRTVGGSLALVVVLGMVVGSAPAALAASSSPAGWLGVLLGRAESPGPEEPGELRGGVEIIGVIEDSPAARARLRARDRIVAVDANPVTSPKDLISRVGSLSPGQWVSLTVLRGDEELERTARLIERPASRNGLKVRSGSIGAEAIDLPRSLREHFGARADSGAMISEVEPGGPAEIAGLLLGDVVYEIDGRPIPSVASLQRAVATAGVGNTIEITLMRNGSEIVLDATVAVRRDDDAP